MTQKTEVFQFQYCGSEVTITHAIQESHIPYSHFEIRSKPRIPLPMTETGYRSWFCPYFDQDEVQLRTHSLARDWYDACVNEKQPRLI